MRDLARELLTSLALLCLMTGLTGIIYPLATTGLARLFWPEQATGSLLRENGGIAGSRLIGRQFDDPRDFWGRLSATAPGPYNGAASSGSNYGPLNPELGKAAQSRIDALRRADPACGATVPVDLVTASGSGLDPHISPEAALYQAGRVSSLRGIPRERIEALIRKHTERRQFGIFGEPRVNVLRLNRELGKTQ